MELSMYLQSNQLMPATIKNILFLVFIIPSFYAIGQIPFPDPGYVFDDTSMPRVDIEINPDSLAWILDASNVKSDHEFRATMIFQRDGQVDELDNIGFRLRGNTSRQSGKKSFKVSVNSFESGRTFYGLQKLNFNGEHNDPTIMRSKLCWDMYRKAGIVGSRSNHIQLYINDEYYGLYINVEHIDDIFVESHYGGEGNLYKCLYPADLHYRGDDPDLYKEAESWGAKAYDLKTNQSANDYSDIAHFVDVLNNTSAQDFQCELESVFEVDDYLRVVAMDILTSNWDGAIFNKNNFYLYNNPATGKFHYIPYDLDNTLGIDWFNIDWAQTNIYQWSSLTNEYRPIYEKIMAVTEYRNKVSFYMNENIMDFFNSNYMDGYLNTFKSKLSDARANDIYASYDYGWGLSDFLKNFDFPLSNHVKYGLSDYINARSLSAASQLVINNVVPIIKNLKTTDENDELRLTFDVQDEESVDMITLRYRIDNGNWQQVDHFGTGTNQYDISLNVQGVNTLDYAIEISDTQGANRSFPQCDYYTLRLTNNSDLNLVINEFLAANTIGNTDEVGEYEDWIEIYNTGSITLSLKGLYLTDNRENPTKWEFPSVILPPDKYVVVWADNDVKQGPLHTNFKLSKDGEFVGLYDSKNNHYAVIDSTSYGSMSSDVSYARMPNGTGAFVMDNSPSYKLSNDGTSSVKNATIQIIEFHPNPANNIIYFDESHKGKTAKIYNIHGQEVSKLIIDTELNTSTFMDGIYYIHIEDKTKPMVSPILIVH